MSGHGHVTPNADGSKARCGGPAICRECQREAGRLPCADRRGQEDQGNEDSVQVTVHGKYGRGPMPVASGTPRLLELGAAVRAANAALEAMVD